MAGHACGCPFPSILPSIASRICAFTPAALSTGTRAKSKFLSVRQKWANNHDPVLVEQRRDINDQLGRRAIYQVALAAHDLMLARPNEDQGDRTR
jgi:hypothetical protein